MTLSTKALLKRNAAYYSFLLLPLTIYFVFFIFPNAKALVWSFFKWDGMAPEMEFVRFRNYVDLFTKDTRFYIALKNTFIYTFILMIGSNLMGLIIALLIHRPSRLNNVFRTIFYLPGVLATVAIGSMWTLGIYNPNFGVLNTALSAIGLESLTTAWLADPKTALACVALVHVWQNLGFSMILYIAGLQEIPEELYEATAIEGASSWQTIWHVTLPLLRRVAAMVMVLVLIFGMRSFDLIFIMTEGGSAFGTTEVLTTLLFRQGFTYRKVGFSNAIAVILLCVVVLTSAIQRWFLREDKGVKS
ncbi:MAG: sugar ABC transporter permease [Spirochaetales bacterium]|nr:sugar ABC transporter permease [Spirochaetales bacterium]